MLPNSFFHIPEPINQLELKCFKIYMEKVITIQQEVRDGEISPKDANIFMEQYKAVLDEIMEKANQGTKQKIQEIIKTYVP